MRNISCFQQFTPLRSSFVWFAQKQESEEKVTAPEGQAPISTRDYRHLEKQVKAAKEVVRKKLIEIGKEAGIPIPGQALMVYIRQKLLYEAKLDPAVKEKVRTLINTMDKLDAALKERQVAEKALREKLNSYANEINAVVAEFEKGKVEEYEQKTQEWKKQQAKRQGDPMAGLEENPHENPEVTQKVAFTEREKTPEEMEEESKEKAEFEMNERIKKGGPHVLAQEMFRFILNGPRTNKVDAKQLNVPAALLTRFRSYAKTLSKGELLNFDGSTVYVTPSVDGNAVKFEWEGKEGDTTIQEHVVLGLAANVPDNLQFRKRAASAENIAQKERAREFLASLQQLMDPQTPAGTRVIVKYQEMRSLPKKGQKDKDHSAMEKREVTVSKIYVKEHMMPGRPDQYKVYTELRESNGKHVKGYEENRGDSAYSASGAQLMHIASEVHPFAVISEALPSSSSEKMIKYMRSAFKKALSDLSTASIAMKLFGQRSGAESKPAKDIYARALKGLSQTVAVYGVEDPGIRKKMAAAGIELPSAGTAGKVALRVAHPGIAEYTIDVDLPQQLPTKFA